MYRDSSAMLSGPEDCPTQNRPGTDRTLLLTLLLTALPLPLLIPAVPRLVGGQGSYRVLALWGLPLGALVLTAALSPEWRRGHLFGGSRGALIRILPWCALALLIDFSCLGVGYGLGWITFTFGDQSLAGHPLRA